VQIDAMPSERIRCAKTSEHRTVFSFICPPPGSGSWWARLKPSAPPGGLAAPSATADLLAELDCY